MLSTEDKKATPFGVESHEVIGSVFSPDGRWIAYAFNPNLPGSASVDSANRGVYIQPFPATGARYQVPKQQIDFHPAWGPKGTELFFVPTAASDRLAAVIVTTQPSVIFGSAASLPARVTGNRINNQTRAWDVLPDGRFVGLIDPSETESLAGTSSQMRVVLNWSEELKAKVPVR